MQMRRTLCSDATQLGASSIRRSLCQTTLTDRERILGPDHQAKPWQRGGEHTFEIPPWQRTPASPEIAHPRIRVPLYAQRPTRCWRAGSRLVAGRHFVLLCYQLELPVADLHPDLHLSDRRQHAAGPPQTTDSRTVRWELLERP
jgi:hypothetical protein